MTWWVALLAGAAAAAALTPVLGPVLERERFQRTNFRGNPIATAGGLQVLLAAVLVEMALTAGDIEAATAGSRRAVVLTAVAFGVLGLLDDLWGEGSVRGFRGHVRALVRGELTTGGLKLVGGGLVALAAAWWLRRDPAEVLAGGAAIALTANVTNLLDRAPGRSTKVASLLLLAAAFVAPSVEAPGLVGAAVVVGAALVALVPELRERTMLGDTGSNALGAAIATALVGWASLAALVAGAAAALALNLLSEVRSYSDLIDRSPPLRALDRLGRRP
jgi:UDP-N-acetylmuramyl pentapeptide phosphotransferase/UDP-N-acetylglucosamine-1-phosphate transferase